MCARRERAGNHERRSAAGGAPAHAIRRSAVHPPLPDSLAAQHGWARSPFTAGGPSKFDFPAPLSLLEPVGSGSAEACGMIKVQAHYNVPNASMTVVDTSSAVRLGVVRDLRPHAQRTEPRYLFLCDADSGFRIPAGREAHTVALECDIGNRAPASLTSVYPHLHTHGTGVRMATARDKRHLAAWPHFDYRKWESRAEPGATLAVNERVRFECTYSTAGETRRSTPAERRRATKCALAPSLSPPTQPPSARARIPSPTARSRTSTAYAAPREWHELPQPTALDLQGAHDDRSDEQPQLAQQLPARPSASSSSHSSLRTALPRTALGTASTRCRTGTTRRLGRRRIRSRVQNF